MVRKFVGIGGILMAFVAGAMLSSVPAFAQQGPQVIEPTLAECEDFVRENGVPYERPVAPDRSYSGYSVCLNMAYDGDLAGYFVSADTNADGMLQSSEQRVYMDSVIGPAGDPKQSPLTVEKCLALIDEYGMPGERPFVDWGNRGYGDVDVCQAMAYDGDLRGSFDAWDVSGDGRLDRIETNAAVKGFGQGRTAAGETEAILENTGVAPDGEEPGGAVPDEAEFAAGDQYEITTDSAFEPTVPEESTGQAEATIPPYEEGTQTNAAPSGGEQETQETQGIVASVGTLIGNALPSTGGGVALFALAGGVVLIGGGFFLYRSLR